MICHLLIANRGEIAIRIARAAAELGIRTVAVFSDDDAGSLHLRVAHEARPLGRSGPGAYLDIERIVTIARDAGCDAIHPGYGFLSENAAFARRCAELGVRFVGPSPRALELFGDKLAARALARRVGVPLIAGTSGPTTLEEARDFLASLGPGGVMMIKAVHGGGGRGTRTVGAIEEVAATYTRCQSEARAAFGSDALYVERCLGRARHVEVQAIGDRTGAVTLVGERECTLQRRHQKLIEVAPSPSLSTELREHLCEATRRLAAASGYDNLGTFEFLLDGEETNGEAFAFIEANPRLQVEHTVTEEVFGIDLVRTQIELAGGRTLAELGLTQADVPAARGFAVQLRINLETMDAAGAVHPTGGTLTVFEPPSGPGIRVDTFGYAGYRTGVAFDSLLAKLVVHSRMPRFADAVGKAYRALCEFRIEGLDTNIQFLQALVSHPALAENRIHTRFIDEHLAELLRTAASPHPRMFFPASPMESAEPLPPAQRPSAPSGTVTIPAPLQGTVLAIAVAAGDRVRAGQQVAVLTAMKMEHLVVAPTGGIVRLVAARPGETLRKDQPIAFIEPAPVEDDLDGGAAATDLDAIRPDLAEVRARHAFGLDAARPAAVAARRRTGQRTARENVEALVDPGSFVEYGALAVAAQRARRSLDDLIANTPGDGVVVGIGTVNGSDFAAADARCLLIVYDYTVLAGTQGQRNHKKQDRVLRVAEQWRLPVILFAEGGGGRPGDTERLGVTGLDVPTFAQFAKLSGLVPLVGVVSGRCFAGNAALLGCCDVIIATANTTLGMGGPAMIEGGGLGVYAPDEVGPVSVQYPNGVIDVVVADETEAARTARQYLAYFQGPLPRWSCADQRELRHVIPENRLRVYDVRHIVAALADAGSVLELRPQFGLGILTALVRIEGEPFGLIANNSQHLGGAIDSDASDKAARFLQLCDAFDLPVVSLIDTPGFMVGPEAEKTALVRHVCRLFLAGASISVPFFSVVLRKGYGLGAMAMAAGGFRTPVFTIAWPTGEFGGMGLEGAVRLGYRKEIEAIADPQERQHFFDRLVARYYEEGKAISIASVLEIDEVIDPADTRGFIIRGLRAMPKRERRSNRKRPCIDAW